MNRKYTNLPVHIVDYHNDALEHIYRAIGSKYLPTKGITLLHFDAHPDMIIPNIPANDVFDKYKLFGSLSIENWITPALYAGHFDTVLWMKANWARQICDGNYEFIIGQHEESSKIRVSFQDDYFLSECLYSPAKKLQNGKNIRYFVKTCHGVPDKHSISEFCNAFSEDVYILDIDLDFFSTKNPIKSLLSEGDYKLLKQVYEFQSPVSRTETEIVECLKKRERDLSNFKLMLRDIEMAHFENWENNPNFSKLRLIYENVVGEPDSNIDAELLHEFGCTMDDPELPHHISTDHEINALLASMETYVASIGRPPTMVTISRSSTDDYCPQDQVDGIQEKVVNSLANLFGDLDVHYHYNKDD